MYQIRGMSCSDQLSPPSSVPSISPLDSTSAEKATASASTKSVSPSAALTEPRSSDVLLKLPEPTKKNLSSTQGGQTGRVHCDLIHNLR